MYIKSNEKFSMGGSSTVCDPDATPSKSKCSSYQSCDKSKKLCVVSKTSKILGAVMVLILVLLGVYMFMEHGSKRLKHKKR